MRPAWRTLGSDVAAGLVLIAASAGAHLSTSATDVMTTVALSMAGCAAFFGSIAGAPRWLAISGKAIVIAATLRFAAWSLERGDVVSAALSLGLGLAVFAGAVSKTSGQGGSAGPSAFRLACAAAMTIGGVWHVAYGPSDAVLPYIVAATLGLVAFLLTWKRDGTRPRRDVLAAAALAVSLSIIGAARLSEGHFGAAAAVIVAAAVVLGGEAKLIGTREARRVAELDHAKRELVDWERIGEYWMWISAAAIAASELFAQPGRHGLFHLAVVILAAVSVFGFRLPAPETSRPGRTLAATIGVTLSFVIILASTGGYRSTFVTFGNLLVYAGAFALPPALVLVPGILLLLYLLFSIVGDPAFPYQADVVLGLYDMLILAIVSAYTLVASRRRARHDRELLASNAGLEASLKAGAAERERLERQAGELGGLNKNLLEMRAALMNVLEDVEESKREIERDRRRENASFDALGEGVVAAGRDGVVFLCNPAAARLLRKDVKAIIGTKLESSCRFFLADSAVLETGMVARAFAGEGGKLPPRLTLLRDDGTRLAVDGAIEPFLDEENRPSGAVLIFRDVTVEREIDRQKSDFVTVASHQLRTPISAIRWFLDLLLSGDAGVLKAQQREFLRDIHASTVRMSGLVNDLLNVSRIESGKLTVSPRRATLHELIDPVCKEHLSFLTTKKLRLEIGLPPEGADVYADPDIARQVLTNVLNNAVKYTPEGGTVGILADRKGESVVIDVTDTGLGIPEAQQHRVFDKFFRAENVMLRETVGTGIGLYIAKSLAEACGGRLTFTSKEGKGSTFSLALPAADAGGRMEP